ncbi:MAG: pyridoxal-phosphate dependent enzyme [Steroidobacteraceae bacterium]
MPDASPQLSDIRAAAGRIAPYVTRTPVMTSRTLDAITGARLYFKCENFQRIGAFKARGAHNAVLSLPPDVLLHGVVTHSSGNHAAALALAARNAGTRAYVAMPHNAPKAKVESVRRLGGEIVFCEPTVPAREACCAGIRERTGAALVHPYDDWRVIAGQGTAALELLEDAPGLDALVAPIGGGGLVSGTAIVGAAQGVATFGTEPAAADDAYRSFVAGSIQPVLRTDTVADGLRTSLSERTFTVIRRHVEDILTVSEAEIVAAMRLVWEVMKIVIEPSSAVPVAALLGAGSRFAGKRVGVILSGGNVDLDALPWSARA